MSLSSLLTSTGVTQTSITGGTTSAAGGYTTITILGKDWSIPRSWIDGFSDSDIETVCNALGTRSEFKKYFDGSRDEPNNALSVITLLTTTYRNYHHIPFTTMSDPGLTESDSTNSTDQTLSDMRDALLSIPGTVTGALGLDKYLYIGLIVLAIIVFK